MAIDGFEWDAPATQANIAAFGFNGTGAGDPDKAAFPKARVVTISECASHAMVDAAIGGVAAREPGSSPGPAMLRRLAEDWLLIADRNFYNWDDWRAAADTGAALLWRVKADLQLPVLELLPDGSYRSVLISPKINGQGPAAAASRQPAAARTWMRTQVRRVRVIEYEVPDRDGDGKGELIALVTTITDPQQAPRR